MIFCGADWNRCRSEWVERYCLTGLEEDPKGQNVLAFNVDGTKGSISLGEDSLILQLPGQQPIDVLQLFQVYRRMTLIVDIATSRGSITRTDRRSSSRNYIKRYTKLFRNMTKMEVISK